VSRGFATIGTLSFEHPAERGIVAVLMWSSHWHHALAEGCEHLWLGRPTLTTQGRKVIAPSSKATQPWLWGKVRVYRHGCTAGCLHRECFARCRSMRVQTMECDLRRAKVRLFLCTHILFNSQTEGPIVSDSKKKGKAGDGQEHNFQE
jgi:hypothetical protein